MHWTRITAVLVMISMLAGCTSYSTIGLQTSESGEVRLSQPILPGDRVRLVMKSGETSEFRVAIVEQDRIFSDTTTYEFKDIQSMEVVRAEGERNTLIVLIAIGVVALAALFFNELEEDIDCAIGSC